MIDANNVNFDEALNNNPMLSLEELLKFDQRDGSEGVKKETVEQLFTCLFNNDYQGLKALLHPLSVDARRTLLGTYYSNKMEHIFTNCGPLHIAAYFCDERVVKLILDNCSNDEINRRRTSFDVSALDFAIIANNPKNVEALLLKGANVDEASFHAENFKAELCGAQVPGIYTKYNAFQLAAFLGRVDVLEVLYKHKKEQMEADRFGASKDTLLHIAVGQNNIDAIIWFIEKGLFVDVTNEYGQIAEDNADANGETIRLFRICKLIYAAKRNDVDKVEGYIRTQQIPINSKFDGETILHAFAKNNNVTALEKMLKSNFMLQSDTQFYTNLDNQTPLEVAAEEGNWQAAYSLIKYKDRYLSEDINLPKAFNIAREKGNYKAAALIGCIRLYDFAKEHKAETAVICTLTALTVCEVLRPGCISGKAKILIPNKVREALLGAVEKMGFSR